MPEQNVTATTFALRGQNGRSVGAERLWRSLGSRGSRLGTATVHETARKRMRCLDRDERAEIQRGRELDGDSKNGSETGSIGRERGGRGQRHDRIGTETRH
eukprot:2184106-Rhodomonas_salina.4